jgi:hypothetical protein
VFALAERSSGNGTAGPLFVENRIDVAGAVEQPHEVAPSLISPYKKTQYRPSRLDEEDPAQLDVISIRALVRASCRSRMSSYSAANSSSSSIFRTVV